MKDNAAYELVISGHRRANAENRAYGIIKNKDGDIKLKPLADCHREPLEIIYPSSWDANFWD